eukprot:15820220-Heterocapsa_arctica.AAC.1
MRQPSSKQIKAASASQSGRFCKSSLGIGSEMNSCNEARPVLLNCAGLNVGYKFGALCQAWAPVGTNSPLISSTAPKPLKAQGIR